MDAAEVRVVEVGDRVRLLLQGASGKYSVEAIVESADSAGVTVRMANSRTLALPASVVASIETLNTSTAGDTWSSATLPRDLQSVLAPLRELEFDTENRTGVSLADQLESADSAIRAAIVSLSYPAHRSMFAEMLDILQMIVKRLRSGEYPDADRYRKEYLIQIAALQRSNTRATARSMPYQIAAELLDKVITAEDSEWKGYLRRLDPRPRIVTAGIVTINVDASGEFLVPVRVTLDDTYLAAEQITVVIDRHRGLEKVGHPQVLARLDPGTTSMLQVRMRDRRRQGARGDLKIEAHLAYAGLQNESRSTGRQSIAIRLRSAASFESIDNPYRDYAGGIPVDDPGMFFGRDGLVDEISSYLMNARSGRCYALYGQKRTGKSSVLQRVQEKLIGDGVLVASVSMGTVDRHAITAGFVGQVVDAYRNQVGVQLGPKVAERLLRRFPDQNEVDKQPLRSLQKTVSASRALLRAEGLSEPRFAVVVDEFTYLFEILRRQHVPPAQSDELRDFMRQWKGFLEAKLFSALVVGQDSMPNFLRAFPNEFSIMHTRRLDYLSMEETERLADEPIRNADGSSRFVGYALNVVPMYTSGHPFFTQIVCDRIVSIVNEGKRHEVAESDVEAAIESLVDGHRQIDFHRFDCMLSADNTGTLLDGMTEGEDAFEADRAAEQILHRIACLAGPQNSPVDIGSLELSSAEGQVFRDLVMREVIRERDGLVGIRVLLFAEYLRRMAL
ncbi:ATP-binding protein [Kribbella endophytica]